MAFGHDAALDLSLRGVARDNVRVPAVLGLRPALSPTRSLRRLESSVVIDGVASITPRRHIVRPADFLRTCERRGSPKLRWHGTRSQPSPNHFEGTTGSSDGGMTATRCVFAISLDAHSLESFARR